MTFNLDTLDIHNKYHFQLKNEKGEILKEETVYNAAKPGLYVAQTGSGIPTSTGLYVYYKRKYRDSDGNVVQDTNEMSVSASLPVYRLTPMEQVDYGNTIVYGGSTDFSSTSFVGTITRFCLGAPHYVTDDEGNITILHWSEAGASGEKDEATSLHVDVTIYMSTGMPSLSGKAFSADLSGILHKANGGMLTPCPKSIAMSALNVSVLPNPLKKNIPTVFALPVETLSLPAEGAFKAFNPTTSTEKDGMLILPSTGYNYGTLQSIVFNGIGAIPISGGDNEPAYIPTVILTGERIKNLLSQELDTYYFFASVPVNCNYVKMTINGTDALTSGLTWLDPNSLSKMRPIAVGMNDQEKISINDYKNTEVGQYYANCLISDYWEPPSGTDTCPKYLYYGSAPNNIRIGAGVGATIQAKVNGNWVTVGSGITYQTVYLDYSKLESTPTEYRAVVSAPPENSRFYVNDAEGLTVVNKTFDPNILCIGDSGNDFGKAGIGISRAKMLELSNGIFAEQKYSGYNIGIVVSTSGFYKSSGMVAYLSYEVKASG